MSEKRSDQEPKPRFTPRPQTQAPALPHIDRVLVVMSGKGGVGKSTVAINLALALKESGLSVGLADMDITNPNAPRMTGLTDFHFKKADGFEPPEMEGGVPVASTQFFAPPGQALIWRGPMKQKMIGQLLQRVAWPRLDVLVVDLPPGTSDEPLSVAQMLPEAEAVLVTTPQRVSTEDIQRSHAFAQKVGMPVLGVVENMSYFTPEAGVTYHIFGKGGGRAMAEELGVPFLGEVPIEPSIAQGGDAGRPVVRAEPESDVSDAFRGIAAAVIQGWDGLEDA